MDLASQYIQCRLHAHLTRVEAASVLGISRGTVAARSIRTGVPFNDARWPAVRDIHKAYRKLEREFGVTLIGTWLDTPSMSDADLELFRGDLGHNLDVAREALS